MTELMRVKARWSGFSGAPGYTVLHFRDFGGGDGGGGAVSQDAAAAAAQRVRTFFLGITGLLPETVDVQVEPEVDVVEDTTGDLVDSFSVDAGGPVEGGQTGTYSAASGAVVNWRTGGIRNGRRIRGRSFIVPVAANQYTNGGILAPSARQSLQSAADALVAISGTPDLAVYARPTSSSASDGQASIVTSATVPSMAAILRSRRD